MMTMGERRSPHPISNAVAAQAGRYLAVIDAVLAMDYLKPDLRRKVMRIQRQLILAEIDNLSASEEPAADSR